MFSDNWMTKFVYSFGSCVCLVRQDRKLPRECTQSKIYSMRELCNNFPIFSFIQFVFLLLRFSWDCFRFCFSVRKIPLFCATSSSTSQRHCVSALKQNASIKRRNEFKMKIVFRHSTEVRIRFNLVSTENWPIDWFFTIFVAIFLYLFLRSRST